MSATDIRLTIIGNVALCAPRHKHTRAARENEVPGMTMYTDTIAVEDGAWRCIRPS